jgi:hypothetical protein
MSSFSWSAGPEKVPQIRIHDPGIIEYRLEDGFQPIKQRLLTYAIIDRGMPSIRYSPGLSLFGMGCCCTGREASLLFHMWNIRPDIENLLPAGEDDDRNC